MNSWDDVMGAATAEAFDPLPPSAVWRHVEARDGFETVFMQSKPTGFRLEGHTAAVEQGEAWAIHYTISLDAHWLTRSAHVQSWSLAGHLERRLESDGSGHWRVDGEDVASLDGCLDVDLEASACTNTFPVHRAALDVGEGTEAPAAWVRVQDLLVERLEQQYLRASHDSTRCRYEYLAPALDFGCRLVFDAAGLVLEYPGIATRVA